MRRQGEGAARGTDPTPPEGHPHDPPPLPAIMIEPSVRAALLEDLGRAGDLTTDAIVPADARTERALMARQPGVVAGPRLRADRVPPDRPGDRGAASNARTARRLAPGDLIAIIRGPARGILTAERTALNFLCHLSGIASATRGIVDAIAGTQAQVVLHAQDHARPARGAEIRGAGRRRIEPPLRPG